MSRVLDRRYWAWHLVVLLVAAAAVAALLGGGGTFASDMNRACAGHHGVFSFDADQGGGVCRDGTAVAP